MFQGSHNALVKPLTNHDKSSVVLRTSSGTLRLTGKVAFPHERLVHRRAVLAIRDATRSTQLAPTPEDAYQQPVDGDADHGITPRDHSDAPPGDADTAAPSGDDDHHAPDADVEAADDHADARAPEDGVSHGTRAAHDTGTSPLGM